MTMNPPIRHPLGLPSGSIRALLTFIVLGQIWALMCLQNDIPLYLIFLMFLVLGSFFAAHGHTITGQPSPLHLPRGSLRTLVVLGFLAVLGYRYYIHRDIVTLWELKADLREQPTLPVILLGGFFIGVFFGHVVVRMISGSKGEPYWYQDIKAWLALLSALGLATEVIIQFVINPSLPPGKELDLPQWQAFLGAVIAFYFGART
jgi:hypothetical protein